MEKFRTPEHLANYLFEKHPTIRFYKDGRVNYGEGSSTWSSFCKRFINPLRPHMEESLGTLPDYEDQVKDKLEDACLRSLSNVAPKLDASFSHLLPVIDARRPDKKALINTRTGRPSSINIESFYAVTGVKVKPVLAQIVFDPYSPEGVADTTIETLPAKRVNLYVRPPWQSRSGLLDLSDGALDGVVMPELVKEYLEHLFPDPECREYVLDWMHYCLISRCETYLILNGAKGAGKGAFYEAIMKPLMGDAYCNIAPESALEANFNSFLDGKRLVLLDEVKANTPAKIAKLKRYVNKDQNIEKKGVDADETVPTFNSFLVSNNDETDFTIEWDDRRFSVADITPNKLEDVWPKEKIDRLFRLTDEEVEHLGNFIFYREPKVMRDEFSVWRGRHYWKLCYVSLPEWGKVVVDMVTSREKASYGVLDLRREYKKRTDGGRFPRPSKINDFLLNYKHEGEYYLGKIVEDGNDFEILVSDHFRPTNQETNEGIDNL